MSDHTFLILHFNRSMSGDKVEGDKYGINLLLLQEITYSFVQIIQNEALNTQIKHLKCYVITHVIYINNGYWILIM